MTRVIGILSWFDESPTWLAATVASFARVCDHLVAVDGRYAHYEDPRTRSGSEQHDAIVETCRGAGMGLTLHSSNRVWPTEMAKRTHCFRVAALEAEPLRDWFFILDGDEVLTQSPSWVRGELGVLAEQRTNVVAVELYELTDPHENPEKRRMSREQDRDYEYMTQSPRFWRALHDMRVDGQHFHYTGIDETGQRVVLWGQQQTVEEGAPEGGMVWNVLDERWERITPWADWGGMVRIENRCLLRDRRRFLKRQEYYDLRNTLGIESANPTTEGALA